MNLPCALIIEDDPKLASIFSASLQAIGLDTIVDLEGNRYKDVLASNVVNILLLDVHLPFASGVEILHWLRADERWKKLPVVVLTADLSAAKSLEQLADRVILKPVGVSRLQEAALGLLASPNL